MSKNHSCAAKCKKGLLPQPSRKASFDPSSTSQQAPPTISTYSTQTECKNDQKDKAAQQVHRIVSKTESSHQKVPETITMNNETQVLPKTSKYQQEPDIMRKPSPSLGIADSKKVNAISCKAKSCFAKETSPTRKRPTSSADRDKPTSSPSQLKVVTADLADPEANAPLKIGFKKPYPLKREPAALYVRHVKGTIAPEGQMLKTFGSPEHITRLPLSRVDQFEETSSVKSTLTFTPPPAKYLPITSAVQDKSLSLPAEFKDDAGPTTQIREKVVSEAEFKKTYTSKLMDGTSTPGDAKDLKDSMAEQHQISTSSIKKPLPKPTKLQERPTKSKGQTEHKPEIQENVPDETATEAPSIKDLPQISTRATKKPLPIRSTVQAKPTHSTSEDMMGHSPQIEENISVESESKKPYTAKLMEGTSKREPSEHLKENIVPQDRILQSFGETEDITGKPVSGTGQFIDNTNIEEKLQISTPSIKRPLPTPTAVQDIPTNLKDKTVHLPQMEENVPDETASETSKYKPLPKFTTLQDRPTKLKGQTGHIPEIQENVPDETATEAPSIKGLPQISTQATKKPLPIPSAVQDKPVRSPSEDMMGHSPQIEENISVESDSKKPYTAKLKEGTSTREPLQLLKDNIVPQDRILQSFGETEDITEHITGEPVSGTGQFIEEKPQISTSSIKRPLPTPTAVQDIPTNLKDKTGNLPQMEENVPDETASETSKYKPLPKFTTLQDRPTKLKGQMGHIPEIQENVPDETATEAPSIKGLPQISTQATKKPLPIPSAVQNKPVRLPSEDMMGHSPQIEENISVESDSKKPYTAKLKEGTSTREPLERLKDNIVPQDRTLQSFGETEDITEHITGEPVSGTGQFIEEKPQISTPSIKRPLPTPTAVQDIPTNLKDKTDHLPQMEENVPDETASETSKYEPLPKATTLQERPTKLKGQTEHIPEIQENVPDETATEAPSIKGLPQISTRATKKLLPIPSAVQGKPVHSPSEDMMGHSPQIEENISVESESKKPYTAQITEIIPSAVQGKPVRSPSEDMMGHSPQIEENISVESESKKPYTAHITERISKREPLERIKDNIVPQDRILQSFGETKDITGKPLSETGQFIDNTNIEEKPQISTPSIKTPLLTPTAVQDILAPQMEKNVSDETASETSKYDAFERLKDTVAPQDRPLPTFGKHEYIDQFAVDSTSIEEQPQISPRPTEKLLPIPSVVRGKSSRSPSKLEDMTGYLPQIEVNISVDSESKKPYTTKLMKGTSKPESLERLKDNLVPQGLKNTVVPQDWHLQTFGETEGITGKPLFGTGHFIDNNNIEEQPKISTPLTTKLLPNIAVHDKHTTRHLPQIEENVPEETELRKLYTANLKEEASEAEILGRLKDTHYISTIKSDSQMSALRTLSNSITALTLEPLLPISGPVTAIASQRLKVVEETEDSVSPHLSDATLKDSLSISADEESGEMLSLFNLHGGKGRLKSSEISDRPVFAFDPLHESTMAYAFSEPRESKVSIADDSDLSLGKLKGTFSSFMENMLSTLPGPSILDATLSQSDQSEPQYVVQSSSFPQIPIFRSLGNSIKSSSSSVDSEEVLYVLTPSEILHYTPRYQTNLRTNQAESISSTDSESHAVLSLFDTNMLSPQTESEQPSFEVELLPGTKYPVSIGDLLKADSTEKANERSGEAKGEYQDESVSVTSSAHSDNDLSLPIDHIPQYKSKIISMVYENVEDSESFIPDNRPTMIGLLKNLFSLSEKPSKSRRRTDASDNSVNVNPLIPANQGRPVEPSPDDFFYYSSTRLPSLPRKQLPFGSRPQDIDAKKPSKSEKSSPKTPSKSRRRSDASYNSINIQPLIPASFAGPEELSPDDFFYYSSTLLPVAIPVAVAELNEPRDSIESTLTHVRFNSPSEYSFTAEVNEMLKELPDYPVGTPPPVWVTVDDPRHSQGQDALLLQSTSGSLKEGLSSEIISQPLSSDSEISKSSQSSDEFETAMSWQSLGNNRNESI